MNTVAYLRERLTRAPAVLVILGSGLAELAEELEDPVRIPYGEIPGFRPATVVGHRGELAAGILNGVEVAAMVGRSHLYEGCEPGELALPVRVMAALGVRVLVVTNAAGGIRSDLQSGDLMLIADHLNLTARNPLVGPLGAGEERFPDMTEPYDRRLREEAKEVARDLGMELKEGVYAAVLGPSFETPAEIRMLRTLGADAVGMSTVPEVIAARALGLKVLGISMISNLAAGLTDAPLSHLEVLEAGKAAREPFGRLLRELVPRIAPENLPSET